MATAPDPYLDYSRTIIREVSESIDFEAARAVALSSIIGGSVKLLRAGREFRACCPFHADRTPSFYVNDDKGFAHCFGCGWHGDGPDFLMAVHGCDVREAVAMITGGSIPTGPRRDRQNVEHDDSGRGDEARAIWHAAGAIEGTPAERYLRNRAINIPIPAALRFARIGLGRRPIMPAMVALVTAADGNPCGIQRTYLTEDGRKASLPDGKVKFSLGRVSGGAIRLGNLGPEVAAAEGIEDGLSLLQMGGLPVLVAAGAGMMKRMIVPSIVSSVIIGADADTAGENAAADAAEAFVAQGRTARIIWPAAPHKDFNQELMEAAHGR